MITQLNITLNKSRLWSVLWINYLLLIVPAGAINYDAVWDGPATGNWNFATNWNSESVPDNGINNYTAWVGTLGTHTVQVNGNFVIDNLMVGGAGIVNIGSTNSQSLELVDAASTIDGLLRFTDHPSYGGSATLILSGPITFGGNGSIDFASNGSNIITGSGPVTFGENLTVQSFYNGLVSTDSIVNGIMQANGGTLIVSSDLTNNNSIRSINNGTFTLDNIMVQNSLGNISVEDGSAFNISGSTISGGILTGGGVFNINGSSVFDGISGITLAPLTTVNVGTTSAESLTTRVNIINNHEYRLIDHPSYGGSASLFLEGTEADPKVYFTGSGKIIFASNGSNQILASVDDPDAMLSLGADQSVTTVPNGNGWIGAEVTNEGIIEAKGGTVAIESPVINLNTLQSVENGTVNLNNILVQNNLGHISVEDGSAFNITGSTISGGILTGGGIFNVNGSSIFDGSSGITLNLDTTVSWGTTTDESLTTIVGIVNNHEYRLADHPAYGGSARLYLEGTDVDSKVYFTGTGKIIFASNGSNQILASVDDPDAMLNLADGQTITTAFSNSLGSLDVPVENYGIIEARGGTITINENVTNNNLIQAVEGGTLNLSTLAVENSNGTINLADATVLNMSDSTISEGVITGMGFINVGGIDNVLTGNSLSLSGPTVSIGTTSNEALTLQGTITNNSMIRLEDHPSYGGTSDIIFYDVVNLNGSGQVRFNSNGNNRLVSGSGVDNRLIQGPAHTIIAPGDTFGEIQVAIVNNGAIDANNGNIILNSEAKINNNLITSRNNGSLSLSTTIENESGTITVDQTSNLTLTNGAVIRGGLIGGGGNVHVNGTNPLLDGSDTDITLDDLTITTGTTSTETINLKGNIINNSTIQLLDHPSYGGAAAVHINGNVNLMGYGSIRFVTNGVNQITKAEPDNTLFVGTGQTITAESGINGYIYPKTVNQGTIKPNGGQLTFYDDLTNESGGLIAGAGSLNIPNGVFVNNGEVSPGLSPGTLNFNSNYSQSDTGSLNIEIGGLTAGSQYDKLNISGHADFDGTLLVRVTDGFIPSPGQVFEIITYGSHSGSFANIVGLGCGGIDRFTITYGIDRITLTATDYVFLSDYDGNNIVNVSDLEIFSSYWLEQDCANTNWCNCTDLDYSGTVDLLDFAQFANYWLIDLN